MIKIKNKEVIKCYSLLRELELPLQESRLRSKFCVILAKHNDDVYVPCRHEVISKFAIEGDNGEVIIPPFNVKEFNKQIKLLEEEELLIECNELNKTMILCLNDILNNEQVFEKLSGEDALIHDMLCDIFEDAVSKYN